MTNDFDREGPGREDEESQDLVEIDLNFDTLRSVHAEFAPDLCRDGLFIATREPLPPSTVVRFRILLPGDFVLAEGTAVVEWTREPGSIPALPPGMALRFVALGGSSQDTINEIVDSHVAAGGFAFELEPSIGEPGEIPTDALAGRDVVPSGMGSAGIGVPRASSDESYRLTVRAAGVPQEDASPAGIESDQEEAPPAMDEEVPEPDEVLPSWLREQAEVSRPRLETDPLFEPPSGPVSAEDGGAALEHDDDGGGEYAAAAFGEREADSGALPEAPDASPGGFDVTFPDDREVADDTTLYPDAEPAAEVTVMQDDAGRSGKRRRAWLALPAALLILGALGVAWWFFLGPGARPMTETPAAVGVEAQPLAGTEPGAVTGAPPTEPTVRPAAVPATAEPPQTVEQESPQPATYRNPASRVLKVSAEPRDGETVLVVRGNGPFSDSAYRLSKLTDPDRVLVRIRGIESGYAPAEIEVGSPEVQRIRVGHHPEISPPTLYVVLDLADSSVGVDGSAVRGDVLTVTVGRR